MTTAEYNAFKRRMGFTAAAANGIPTVSLRAVS
jgi:hypothetical protein